MKLSKLHIGILSGLGVIILVLGVGLLFKDEARSYINEIRAERLQVKAEEAFANELWDQASRQGRAAHYLDPDNGDIKLLVARALLRQRMASATDWWKLVVKEPDLPVEDLRTLTEILLNSDQLDDALLFLSRLVELDPESEETRRIWLRALEMQRRYRSAVSVASELAEGGVEDWSVHRMYMALQTNLLDKEGEERVIAHLKNLVEADGPLSLMAARELAAKSSAEAETRLLATDYLEKNAQDDLDRLYARSVEVMENRRDREDLMPILDRLLEDPEEGMLEELLLWADWMEAEEWYLKNVSWETYRDNGGVPDPYLKLLLDQEAFRDLVELTEREFSEGDSHASAYLYYRAAALERLGLDEQAESALRLAIEVVEPEKAPLIEAYLIRDGRWELLSRLYGILLKNEPDNPFYLFKALGANYYTGRQENLRELLSRVDLSEFDDDPAKSAFVLYLRLLVNGVEPQIVTHLEKLMARYAEVFDFRLAVGIAYLLQGQDEVARGMTEQMPELNQAAPRHLRVSAMLLGSAGEELLIPGELELLLPRERFLMSRKLAESNSQEGR